MDVSKLPILIADPTKEAINNFLNSDLVCFYKERYNAFNEADYKLDFFYNLVSDKNLGKLLLYVYKHPNIKLSALDKKIKNYNDFQLLSNFYATFNIINIAIGSKLIKKMETKHKFEYLISVTELGMQILKQNGLID